MLIFRFSGTTARPVWELFRHDDSGGKPIQLADKCCHQCKHSFAAMTAVEVRDTFWLGGMAE